MKQKAQWLSQVWRASKRAECTSTPERLAGAPWRTSTVRSSPPRSTSRLRSGPSVSTRQRIRSRAGSPSTADHLVAHRQPGRARRANRARRRRCGGGTRRTGYGAEPSVASIDVPVDHVLLAAPRGFCAGVEMAIKALAWMVRAFEPPVYCYHEIVHNRLVVRAVRAARRGVRRRRSTRCPRAARSCSRPTARPPRWSPSARARGSVVVNAVCPLVTKVHHEVKRRAGEGYRIVYVGHAGHEEAVGTMAVAPDAIDLVETPGRGRGPRRPGPARRPARPDHAVAPRVGRGRRRRPRPLPRPLGAGPLRPLLRHHQPPVGAHGHRPPLRRHRRDRLGELLQHPGARAAGRPRPAARGCCGSTAPTSCPADLHGTVGVTAGASAPDELVDAVLARLAPVRGRRGGPGHRRGRVLPAAPGAAGAARRRSRSSPPAGSARLHGGARPCAGDRQQGASAVLAALA